MFSVVCMIHIIFHLIDRKLKYLVICIQVSVLSRCVWCESSSKKSWSLQRKKNFRRSVKISSFYVHLDGVLFKVVYEKFIKDFRTLVPRLAFIIVTSNRRVGSVQHGWKKQLDLSWHIALGIRSNDLKALPLFSFVAQPQQPDFSHQ